MTAPTIEILFQDEHILAINKPSGVLSIPDGGQSQAEHVRNLLEPRFGRLWTVHRLDRETSGVLLLARDLAAHHALNDQFASRNVKKEYRAIVSGTPDLDTWRIDLALLKNGDRSHRTIIDLEDGKPASTTVTVLERYPGGYSLLSVRPHTGYTHQIRAHLAACGLPILGDPLYQAKPHASMLDELQVAPVRRPVFADRLGLHAFTIQFTHPVSQVEMTLTAPYPADFSAVLLEVKTG
ncbi:pseudouridine synthase, RluA family [Longilinea arvoryzae]|uniref:Pseudouridine synthase n=1 Tax=Longilinea arvoryzae TaxID=360412 RepID=A0A0S7BAQ8_9CHLR|nr:RluA family pseudouridine synthase [Longilinea arvoryzae]GAP14764.1 pseudouridine synthase, RluA family [Longilinea arvoryzae]